MIVESLAALGLVYAMHRVTSPRRPRAAGSSSAEISRAYATWAERVGFVEHGDDARYRGTVDRVDVIIDNGVRASGCYGVEARLAVATGDPPGPVREADAATTALRAAIREVVAAEAGLLGARIEPSAVVLRLAAEQEPEQVERIVRRMISICRPVPAACGPYR